MPSEVAQLIAIAGGVDGRETTQLAIGAWLEVLGDVTFEEARTALVEHRREEPGVRVEPGHLRRRALAGRERANGPSEVSAEGLRIYEALGGSQAAWAALGGDTAAEQKAIVEQRARRPKFEGIGS